MVSQEEGTALPQTWTEYLAALMLSIEVSWHLLRAALHNRHDAGLYTDIFTIDIAAALGAACDAVQGQSEEKSIILEARA